MKRINPESRLENDEKVFVDCSLIGYVPSNSQYLLKSKRADRFSFYRGVKD
jgi:hypothetical protein